MEVRRRGTQRDHGFTVLFSTPPEAIYRAFGDRITVFAGDHQIPKVREPGREASRYTYEAELTTKDVCRMISLLAQVESEHERRDLQLALKAMEADLVRLLAFSAGFSRVPTE